MSEPDQLEGTFEVRLARTGMTLPISPESTILDEVLMAGLKVNFSCMTGICGSCRTEVIEGIPDHRDEVLTDKEREKGDCIILCCSRSLSSVLVLDL